MRKVTACAVQTDGGRTDATPTVKKRVTNFLRHNKQLNRFAVERSISPVVAAAAIHPSVQRTTMNRPNGLIADRNRFGYGSMGSPALPATG